MSGPFFVAEMEQMEARAADAEKAQNTLAAVFKISEGKARQKDHKRPKKNMKKKHKKTVTTVSDC